MLSPPGPVTCTRSRQVPAPIGTRRARSGTTKFEPSVQVALIAILTRQQDPIVRRNPEERWVLLRGQPRQHDSGRGGDLAGRRGLSRAG